MSDFKYEVEMYGMNNINYAKGSWRKLSQGCHVVVTHFTKIGVRHRLGTLIN